MGAWIYSLLDELSAEVGVPVVLDLVVCAARYPPSYQRPPVCFRGRREDETLREKRERERCS